MCTVIDFSISMRFLAQFKDVRLDSERIGLKFVGTRG